MIRGRFAPTPSGELHLGNARTALLAWLHARAVSGRFVLRVDDLDPGRSRDVLRDAQLTDLRWLGLDWDEGPDVGGPGGPYMQSLRGELYEAALRRLAERGLLYTCYCSRREILAASSAPHQDDEEGPPYPGTCSSGERRPIASGAAGAARFRVPRTSVSFLDELAGERTFRPAAEVGDFVVRRKDGVASYQLATVVDDAAMGITHVVRGADLLPSTARQILLYEALDLQPPVWIHVPLLLGGDGERLSKRHGAVSLREHREAGVTPARLVGWLAATGGLVPPGTEAMPSELVARADPNDLVPRTVPLRPLLP